MAQQLAFVAPTTEEMTRVAVVGGGAFVTGGVESVVATVAPKLGALAPIAEWGVLLGVPAGGALLALMTRGILSDLGLGIAAGGAAVFGNTLPAMLLEFTAARPNRGQLTAEQRAALAAGNVKLLGTGPLSAAAKAQAATARSILEF